MPVMPGTASAWSVLLALLCASGCAKAPSTSATAALVAPPTTASSLTAQFAGRWTGQLEYRDFQSDAQVSLPTWLTIRERPDHASLELDYVYDDGPNKTVRERMILAFDRAASTARMTSDRDHTSEVYAVEGLDAFAKQGRGTLILTGPGTENDKPVQVRITLTLRRNLYTLRKETQHAGEDFKFRDAYTFTRAEPPS